MFLLLLVISVLACIVCFFLMLTNFEGYVLLFLSTLISAIINWKLYSMEEKLDEQEKEIKKLKEHLGIQEKSTDNANDNNNKEDKE